MRLGPKFADHQDALKSTESLKDESLYNQIQKKLNLLGRMLNKFIQAVEKSHNTCKDEKT